MRVLLCLETQGLESDPSEMFSMIDINKFDKSSYKVIATNRWPDQVCVLDIFSMSICASDHSSAQIQIRREIASRSKVVDLIMSQERHS